MAGFLVTGAGGLTGNYVVRELISRGLPPSEVLAFGNSGYEVLDDVRDAVTFVPGDVSDAPALFEVFDRYRPDHVVHLAAVIAHEAWDDPSRAITVNALGTNHVFDAMGRFGVRSGLYASSSSVYGQASSFPWKGEEVVVDEDDPVATTNPYGVTKYLNEVMARRYAERDGLALVGVRIGGVWGHGRYVGGAGMLNSFIRDVGLGRPTEVPEMWLAVDRMHMSYGKDVGRQFVDLCLRAEGGLPRPVYNQGTRQSYDVHEVCRLLEELVPDARILPRSPDAEAEPWIASVVQPGLDCSRWYDELGFTEEWPLALALADFVDHHRRAAGLEPVG